jgi:hypothetical protein
MVTKFLTVSRNAAPAAMVAAVFHVQSAGVAPTAPVPSAPVKVIRKTCRARGWP